MYTVNLWIVDFDVIIKHYLQTFLQNNFFSSETKNIFNPEFRVFTVSFAIPNDLLLSNNDQRNFKAD